MKSLKRIFFRVAVIVILFGIVKWQFVQLFNNIRGDSPASDSASHKSENSERKDTQKSKPSEQKKRASEKQ